MIDLTNFEYAVLTKLLDGKHRFLALLRDQLASCRVSRREFTGAGFYTHLHVDNSLALGDIQLRFGDVVAEINEMPHGAGFVLYIKNGRLSLLEGYGYDDPWPIKITTYTLRYITGEERNWDELKEVLVFATTKEKKNMATIESVTERDDAAMLDELLWTVLWQPFGLPRDMRHLLKREGEEFALLARKNAQLVGGLVAVLSRKGEMEIRHLAVDAHVQGQGIGRSLVAELCRIAENKNCKRIHTIARNTSVAFFRKLGFRISSEKAPSHPIFLKHGITFEIMEK